MSGVSGRNPWDLASRSPLPASLPAARLRRGPGRRHAARRDRPRQSSQRPDPEEPAGLLPTSRHRPYHLRRDAHRPRDQRTGMNISFGDPPLRNLRTVGPRIRMMMPHLTPLEGRVVDTILNRRGFDAATPLKTVAEEAGVSEAMVIKIAKKLGFAGFKDFRLALDGYNRLPTAELHQELSPTITGRRSRRRSSAPRSTRSRRRSPSSTQAPSSARPIRSSAPASATSTASAAPRRSPGTCRTSSSGSASAPACSTTRI